MSSRWKYKTFLSYVVDFLILNLAFIGAVFIKRRGFELDPEYRNLLFVYYVLWFISSFLSNKYKLKKPRSYVQGIKPFFRGFAYLSFLLLFVIFIYKLFFYSRFIVLATLLLFINLELLIYTIYYIRKWGAIVKTLYEDFGYLNPLLEKTRYQYTPIDKVQREIKEPLRQKLKKRVLKDYPGIFNFANIHIDLNKISASDSLLIDSKARESIEDILIEKLEFIVNLGLLNNYQWITKFLNAANKKLVMGGYFVGVVETIEQRKKRRSAKYPKIIRKPLFYLDFVWTRIFPKIFGLKFFYFAVRGRPGRVVSKVETIGRLVFSGFEIIEMKEIENKLFFITRKVREPLKEDAPPYGMIFKQGRVGQHGEIIYTYKFRTMYPFSEYAYQYVYDKYKLDNRGKIKNDIRVTGWGRFMRKFWIDELPMIINFLHGDLKLVGVRPISRSFFELYPEDLQKERIKQKPGLIPSLYAGPFRTKPQIFKYERQYLQRFRSKPIRTDLSYLFRALYRIIFKGVRSG